MKWAMRVGSTGERKGSYRLSVGKPEGKNHLEDLGVDGRIVLEWIYNSGMGHELD